MLVTRPRIVGPAALCALLLVASVAAPTAGAADRARPSPTIAQRPAAPTMALATAPAASRSTPMKLLLSAAALVVGVLVGLLPALLLGLLLGLVPRPQLLGSRRPARPPRRLSLERPAPEHAPPAAEQAPAALAPAALAAVLPLTIALPEAPVRADVDAVRKRHRGLYDDEYSKQLRHIDALRQTISTRLAVPADALAEPPLPPSNGGSSPTESDAS
jgi:hypothetical protein